MIDLETLEGGTARLVEDRATAVEEAKAVVSSGRVVMTEEGMVISELCSKKTFVEKVLGVVAVAVVAIGLVLMLKTEIPIFHPSTAIALTVELVVRVVVITVQSPGFSGAVGPKVSTILDGTGDRQSPFSLLSGVAFSPI